VRDAPGVRLRPHPPGPHAEALGDLPGGQRTIHGSVSAIAAAGDASGVRRDVVDRLKPVTLVTGR
jgi:hypothetical protein